MTPQLILASASPARRQLLEMAGFTPIVRPSYFDESQIQKKHPDALVKALAEAKAQAVAQTLPEATPALVLGCDSVLFLDNRVWGKPTSRAEAVERWQHMRGRQGYLYTGHTLIDWRQQRHCTATAISQVEFARLSDAEIAAYVGSGEPLACAGAFALEGRGGLFVTQIQGCPSNIIGLSLPLFRQMLLDLGYRVEQFWSP